MRKVISLTLMLSAMIELVTSIVLYIIPSGRVAYWNDYRLLGLSKHQWGDLHITVGFLLVGLGGVHLYLNWKAIRNYLRNKAREFRIFTRSFNFALLITAFVVAGTLTGLPPMSWVVSLGEWFTDRGNERHGEPPYGHAELSSLRMFCTRMNLDLERSLERLDAAGIGAESEKETLQDLARRHGITPQRILDCIQPAAPGGLSADGIPTFPEMPSPGFGSRTLAEICAAYGLDPDGLIEALRAEGVEANANQKVKAVAEAGGTNPMAVFEIIRDFATTE